MANLPIEFGLNEAYIEGLKESYGERFDAVRKAFPNFTEDQEVRLGILLENVNRRFTETLHLNEATQAADIAKGIKTQYFDIITAVWPNLIAEQLFSVQPIRSKTGQIFYLKYVYGTNKGNVKRGDTIFAANEIAGYENRNYTSEIIENENLFATDGTEKDFNACLQFLPVMPGSVKIEVGGAEILDDGNGVLKGTGVTGTIEYDSGTVELNFTTAPSAEDVFVDYQYDLSFAPSTIPSIELRVEDQTITARPRKLKGIYSLDAGYDLKMSQGINIDDTLLEAAAMVLKNEVDAELIMTAFMQAASTVTWTDGFDANKNPGISKKEYYEGFVECIVRASSCVKQKTKRVEANWVVVGKKAADILRFIGAPRFVASGDTTVAGPCYLGMLDGTWKVYYDPFLGEDQFLLGFKGSNLMDAGLIYAPYLMFFATEPVMLEDFLGRRGFATIYGKKMVNQDMYVRGSIIKDTKVTTD